jgi:hypothetical protein
VKQTCNKQVFEEKYYPKKLPQEDSIEHGDFFFKTAGLTFVCRRCTIA